MHLTDIIEIINKYLWDYFLLIVLFGSGIYFTFKLRFVQIRKFPQALKKTFSGINFKEKAGKDGMSSFQALATSIAAQIGTGSLAGAAVAICLGGPGAIFWMWVSAFFGMATIYIEAVLAQKYKTTVNGEAVGGSAYYIKQAFRGIKGKLFAFCFSILLIISLGFIGNMVQSNSISEAFKTFNIPPYITGILIVIFAGFIFIGGISRLASFTEKIVPIMALFYIIGCFVIIFANIDKIPGAFKQIFTAAFAPASALGGAAGITVQKAIRFGVAKGLFSNEAGMGSTPHAHAIAKVKHPCEQGGVAMVGVFIDTFVVLTLTALVILITGVYNPGAAGDITGVQMTAAAFSTIFGSFGGGFVSICIFFFAFSSIIGWYFFGEQNVKYIFKSRSKFAVRIYSMMVLIFVYIGCNIKVEFVWSLADTFNAFMVIPNIIALLILTNVVRDMMLRYEGKPIPKK